MADAADGPLAAVLAIDGGNSKTDVAPVAGVGTLLASARGPGASQEEHGVDGAVRIRGMAGRRDRSLCGAMAPARTPTLLAASPPKRWVTAT